MTNELEGSASITIGKGTSFTRAVTGLQVRRLLAAEVFSSCPGIFPQRLKLPNFFQGYGTTKAVPFPKPLIPSARSTLTVIGKGTSFTRAVAGLQVRRLSAAEVSSFRRGMFPQGLKPSNFTKLYGTAKGVPFPIPFPAFRQRYGKAKAVLDGTSKDAPFQARDSK
jgi:hypothetical protein